MLGYVTLGEGACGSNDVYHMATITLQECMERCIKNAACTAVTFKEGHGGCGIHKGAVKIIPNSNSGGWPSGCTCYKKQGKTFDNFCSYIYNTDLHHMFISMS